MALVSWALREKDWPLVCEVAAVVGLPLQRARRAKRAALREIFGPDSQERLLQRITANIHLRTLQYLRVFRPGGWHPRMQLEGRERIEAERARGQGVILWVAPLVFSDLVTKMALSGAGFQVSHLSMVAHGFSMSKVGGRVFNRFTSGAEEKFLRSRLVMSPDGSLEALRELAGRVRDNEVVSISAVASAGKRTLDVPFLRGAATIAAGAPELARRTGAGLLPVFTVRLEDGSFRTTVEPAIDVSHAGRSDALRSAAEQYITHLEQYARAWPEQYSVLA
jgi:lauroyl/myristoyl acyltransferase